MNGLNGKTNEELLELYQQTNSLDVKQELALRYLYVVKSIAIQMRDVYVSFTQLEDIVHEGVITLMSALDKFDFDKNVKFETYVSKRIRGMIIDIARKQDWVPRSVRKNFRDISEMTAEYYGKHGQMPTDSEVVEKLNMDMEKYQDVMGKSNLFSILSLDMVLEETSEKRRTTQIPSADSDGQPEAHYLQEEFKGILADGIRSLKENEQMVVSLYYVEELNMKKIAEVMQISEPRVSQVHSNAIRKLKKYIQETADIADKKEEESYVSRVL